MDRLKSVEVSLNSAIESSERRESETRSAVGSAASSPPSKNPHESPASISSSSHQVPANAGTPGEKKTVRERIELVIDHHYCHMVVVGLVLLDVVFVLIELLLDLNIARDPHSCDSSVESHATPGKHAPSDYSNTTHEVSLPSPRYDHVKSSGHEQSAEAAAASVFHYLSMSVLCLFLIEYVLKIYVFRAAFFTHCMEIFDLIVVTVSLIFESIFHHSHALSAGTGLLVALRLWRVARIINGIVLSVKIRAKEKLLAEREERRVLEHQLDKTRARLELLERELNALSTAVQKTLTGNQKAALNKVVSEELSRTPKRNEH